MLDPDNDPRLGSTTPPDPELTDMERFFDTLFNQHMVLPQTPEDPNSSEGSADHDAAQDNPGVSPV